jgi:GNAT superfamily N-acetyltransferase
MIEDQATIIVCEFEGSELVGFVSGGLGLKGIYLSLLKRPVALIWSLRGLVSSFQRLRGVMEILLFSISSGEKSKISKITSLPSAELYTIGVSERVRGSGVASRLYESLGEAFLVAGVKEYKILVGDQLTAAHGFYEKMGAVPVLKECLHGDKPSTIYIQSLDK